MEDSYIIETLLGIVLAGVAFWMNVIRLRTEDNSKLIHDTRENYVTKSEYSGGLSLLRDEIKGLREDVRALTDTIIKGNKK